MSVRYRQGGPGYSFEDECTAALKHDRPGYSDGERGAEHKRQPVFITHVPTPWLNGKHTVFGAVIDDSDMATVNSIQQGDTIESVTIEGDTAGLFSTMADRIEEWNSKLKKK